MVRAALKALRLAVARDELGRDDPQPPGAPAPASSGVLHVLFVSREPLGTEPEQPAPARLSFLRLLFGREALPLDPVPAAPARRSRLATVFGLEKLEKLDEDP